MNIFKVHVTDKIRTLKKVLVNVILVNLKMLHNQLILRHASISDLIMLQMNQITMRTSLQSIV